MSYRVVSYGRLGVAQIHGAYLTLAEAQAHANLLNDIFERSGTEAQACISHPDHEGWLPLAGRIGE